MDSIYFEDPLGLLIELASYRFEPPAGHTHADVLLEAHSSVSSAATTPSTAITSPTPSSRSPPARGESLSDDRTPKDPYRETEEELTWPLTPSTSSCRA